MVLNKLSLLGKEVDAQPIVDASPLNADVLSENIKPVGKNDHDNNKTQTNNNKNNKNNNNNNNNSDSNSNSNNNSKSNSNNHK